MKVELTSQQRFFDMINVMGELTGTQLGDFMIELYDEELKPFGYDKVNIALKRLLLGLNSKKPMPSINDIKEAMGEIVANPRVRATAIAAQIRGILFSPSGRYDDLDEVGKEVVRQCGGWSTLTGTDYEQLEYQVKNWQGLAEDIIAHPQKHARFHEQLAGPAKNVVADLLAGKDPTRSLK